MKKNIIQKKLFLSLYTFLLIVLFLVSVLSYFFIFENLKQKEIESLISKTSSAKKNIEMVLKMVESLDNVIYNNNHLMTILSNDQRSINFSDNTKINNFLDNLTHMNAFVKGIHIVGKDKFFFSSVEKLEREMLKTLINDEKFENNIQKISVDYYKPFSNNDIISYHLPIYNFKSHDRIGKIIVDISIDYFSELFISSVMEGKEKVFIVDSNNNILFNYPANIDFNYILEKKELSQWSYIDNKNLLSSEIIKYSDWRYIRIIPINETIFKFSKILGFMIFLIFIIMLISSFFTFKFSIIFTDPIIELNRNFKEMEKGNLDLIIDFKRKDEIGELGNSFNKMVKELKLLIKTQVSDQKRKDELKFQILQAQINPHFIYNTLDSIRWMAIIQNIPNIRDMTSSIIKLLQYNISTEEDIVPISLEIESINNYLMIQKFRYGNRFSAVFEMDEQLLSGKIVRFALQPLIENSFFHGFDLDSKTGLFKIRLFEKNKDIILEIEDNGNGLKEKNSKKDTTKMHTGIGLKNIDERIKLYFGIKYGLSIFQAEDGGALVRIKLPLEKSQ